MFDNDIDIVLFADDTSLIIKEKTDVNISEKLCEVINKTEKWFSVNNMLLNVDKTHVIRFALGSRSGDVPREVREILKKFDIAPVDNVKFLGVYLDSKMTWDLQINNLKQKLSSATYAIKKIKELCGLEAAKNVYFAYFHSLMTYGVLFWGTASSADTVFVLQKRALRYILGLKYRDSCRDQFRKVGIMTMIGEYIYQSLLYVKDNITYIPTLGSGHNYNTRHKNRLGIPKHRLVKLSKTYLIQGIKMYNKLPEYIQEMSHKEFCTVIRKILINKSYYSIDEALDDDSLNSIIL